MLETRSRMLVTLRWRSLAFQARSCARMRQGCVRDASGRCVSVAACGEGEWLGRHRARPYWNAGRKYVPSLSAVALASLRRSPTASPFPFPSPNPTHCNNKKPFFLLHLLPPNNHNGFCTASHAFALFNNSTLPLFSRLPL